MSYDEYVEGIAVAVDTTTFNALIYAALCKADSENFEILKYAWPSIWAEYEIRHDSPGGRLEGETASEEDENFYVFCVIDQDEED